MDETLMESSENQPNMAENPNTEFTQPDETTTTTTTTMNNSSPLDTYQRKRKLSGDLNDTEHDANDAKKEKHSSFNSDMNTDNVITNNDIDRTSEEIMQKSNMDILDEAHVSPVVNHLAHAIDDMGGQTTHADTDTAATMNSELLLNITNSIKDLNDHCMSAFEQEKPALPPEVCADVAEKVDAEKTLDATDAEKPAEDKTDAGEEKKKVTNMRKNIRELLDETQLDEVTLTAQRLEIERLNRVQEAQRAMRETQRQNRVISLLQGNHSLIIKSNREPQTDKVIDVDSSATETTKTKDGKPDASSILISEDSGDEDKEKPAKPKDVVTVTVDSSSDSDDDCILLSDVDDDEDDEDDGGDAHNSGLHVNDKYNTPDEYGRVVINIGHADNEDDIFLAPQIARNIKPHQIGGVRFLYENIIESLERFKSSDGFGCILAHSMGLGKTLQLCCFCDIFLRHTGSKSVLCIMPINTLQNWVAEFNMWLPDYPTNSPLIYQGEVRPRNFQLYVLNDTQKSLQARSKVIIDWSSTGGVLLIGYELFRLLSMKKLKRRKTMRNVKKEERKVEEEKVLLDQIHAALVDPGPDLVVCDEGHRIKNSHASISVALKQIRSKRRIVLTGYPLQNNLLEYWCMVDFVRPNYLGSRTEFCNMFERPIQNGQCVDSTPQDIKLMRYRAHVLHSLLLGFVQRRSHIVLQSTLPQKDEYVLLIRLTEFQRKLYEVFMNEVVRKKAVPNPLKAFAVCCKIWNHPDVLFNYLKKREFDLDLEETYNNITADEAKSLAADLEMDKAIRNEKLPIAANNNNQYSSLLPGNSLDASQQPSFSDILESENADAVDMNGANNGFYGKHEAKPNDLISNGNGESGSSLDKIDIDKDSSSNTDAATPATVSTISADVKDTKSARDDVIPYDWAVEAMRDYVANVIENSPKVDIFFAILEKCIQLGDKLLLFSQSLLTLNLLEQFLKIRPVDTPHYRIFWRKNDNYFRKFPIL